MNQTGKSHRPYDKEFKDHAVEMLIESGRPLKAVARDLCAAYEVSRHGYGQWRRRQGQDRQAGEERLVVEIKAIHKKSRGSYGAPKMTEALRTRGAIV